MAPETPTRKNYEPTSREALMEALDIDRFVDKLREFNADALLTVRVRVGGLGGLLGGA